MCVLSKSFTQLHFWRPVFLHYSESIFASACALCANDKRSWMASAREIERVSFSPLSSHEAEALSVCEVTKCTLGSMRDADALNSLFDPRMGSTSPFEKCPTCGSSQNSCDGHFGHHVFPLPIIHPLHHESLFKRLRETCYHCHATVIGTVCSACERKQGKWCRDAVGKVSGLRTRYYHKLKTTIQQHVHFTALEAAAFVRAQPDCEAFFVRVLPISPTCTRPSRRSAAGWTHNPMTHAYSAIIKESNNLHKFYEQNIARHAVLMQLDRLDAALAKLYDSSKFSDDRAEGIRQRLDGKQGRFRQNLLGKRVDCKSN